MPYIYNQKTFRVQHDLKSCSVLSKFVNSSETECHSKDNNNNFFLFNKRKETMTFFLHRCYQYKSETSMIWQSQNFLLYNGTVMQQFKKEKNELVWQFPFLRCIYHVQIITILISKKRRQFKNQQSIIIHVPLKSISCLPDDFLTKCISQFFVKDKKKSINLV